MTMDPLIAAKLQIAAPGKLVELFDLDLRPIDPTVQVLHFVPSTREVVGTGGLIRWQGNQYVPLPIEIDPITVSGSGALPRPKVRISNVFSTVTDILRTYGRIGGAILTRWQTFSDFLDDGSAPTPAAAFPTDVFVFDRVISHNKSQVEIECRSFLDFEKRKLPARQMLQSACTHTYRLYNAVTLSFDYSHATCPYIGGLFFDTTNTGTNNPANDMCSKLLTGCKLRFPGAPLPTRAFPGLGRYQ